MATKIHPFDAQLGKFYRDNDGDLVMCVGEVHHVMQFVYLNIHGELEVTGLLTKIEPVPACTGWDWQEVSPGDGWRLLDPNEKIEAGDEYLSGSGKWIGSGNYGTPVSAAINPPFTVAYRRACPRLAVHEAAGATS